MDTKETQESFGLHFFPVITCNRLYWKEDKETIIGLILSTGRPYKKTKTRDLCLKNRPKMTLYVFLDHVDVDNDVSILPPYFVKYTSVKH